MTAQLVCSRQGQVRPKGAAAEAETYPAILEQGLAAGEGSDSRWYEPRGNSQRTDARRRQEPFYKPHHGSFGARIGVMAPRRLKVRLKPG